MMHALVSQKLLLSQEDDTQLFPSQPRHLARPRNLGSLVFRAIAWLIHFIFMKWFTFLMKKQRLSDSKQISKKDPSLSQNSWYVGWQDSCLPQDSLFLKIIKFKKHKLFPCSKNTETVLIPLIALFKKKKKKIDRLKKREGEKSLAVYQKFNVWIQNRQKEMPSKSHVFYFFHFFKIF